MHTHFSLQARLVNMNVYILNAYRHIPYMNPGQYLPAPVLLFRKSELISTGTEFARAGPCRAGAQHIK